MSLGFALGVTGCGLSAPSDPGLEAELRVEGAQYYPGSMPDADRGPSVVSTNLPDSQAAVGELDHPFTGALDASATAALVGLVGDAGYWVLVAGSPSIAAPGFPTFDASMDFSPTMDPGNYTLRVQASDESGHFGATALTPIHVVPTNLPSGTLVVALSWDTESDLDLHVVVPGGVEVFARNINSVATPAPGKPVDPNAYESGGILDFDSNENCVIDGRRRENVVWSVPPPSGTYIVRVDTFSLCAAAFANWSVAVVLDGDVIARARGSSNPIDAEGPHDRGSGVLALTFAVP
ncbi:MAG TPA: hypothetical protein VH142_02140 [Polyangiaceae bacterium]|nr:hypothetical protein [Polyangiaceae bacterium]